MAAPMTPEAAACHTFPPREVAALETILIEISRGRHIQNPAADGEGDGEDEALGLQVTSVGSQV
jgi:hypothetical protein